MLAVQQTEAAVCSSWMYEYESCKTEYGVEVENEDKPRKMLGNPDDAASQALPSGCNLVADGTQGRLGRLVIDRAKCS